MPSKEDLLDMVAREQLSVTFSKFLCMVTTRDGKSYWAYFEKPNKNFEDVQLYPRDKAALVALEQCFIATNGCNSF